MRPLLPVLLVLPVLPLPAAALSGDAREFMAIARQLEPVHCQKRKLRYEITLAQVEQRDAQELKRRFAALDQDPKTASLEKRLAELQPRIARSSDPEDLAAISAQHGEAFYRCE